MPVLEYHVNFVLPNCYGVSIDLEYDIFVADILASYIVIVTTGNYSPTSSSPPPHLSVPTGLSSLSESTAILEKGRDPSCLGLVDVVGAEHPARFPHTKHFALWRPAGQQVLVLDLPHIQSYDPICAIVCPHAHIPKASHWLTSRSTPFRPVSLVQDRHAVWGHQELTDDRYPTPVLASLQYQPTQAQKAWNKARDSYAGDSISRMGMSPVLILARSNWPQPIISPSTSDAQHDVEVYTAYFALLSPGIAHSIYFGGSRLDVTSKKGVDDVRLCPVLGTYLYQVAVLARTLFAERLYSLSRRLLSVDRFPRLLGQGAYDTTLRPHVAGSSSHSTLVHRASTLIMSATQCHAHAAHVPSASAYAVRWLMFDNDGGGMRQMRAYRAAVFVVLVQRTHLHLGLLSPPLTLRLKERGMDSSVVYTP
ncbi:hypothetical protein BJ912DRAFT_1065007 [Pholiota molesta]|nr:hypothetical protein BJ912DRAFT_1065007 [Pholiota molesta]